MSIVELDGPPSCPLDSSETGEGTTCPWVVGVRYSRIEATVWLGAAVVDPQFSGRALPRLELVSR